MSLFDLTESERNLYRTLPRPPETAEIRVTNVWIIEWLPLNERSTGLELHESIERKRSGWSQYLRCGSKLEVISAIDQATAIAGQKNFKPILHIEAHGCSDYLQGPDGNTGKENLTWGELTKPLQRLNIAIRCNLIVFIAACVGIAGILALKQGPAPAILLVGPEGELGPKQVVDGAKEYYQRLLDKDPDHSYAVESASREAVAVIEKEPFAVLCHEAHCGEIITSLRPENREQKIQALYLKYYILGKDVRKEQVEQLNDPTYVGNNWQKLWDNMFMIDLYPENRSRFGLNMNSVVETVFDSQRRSKQ